MVCFEMASKNCREREFIFKKLGYFCVEGGTSVEIFCPDILLLGMKLISSPKYLH